MQRFWWSFNGRYGNVWLVFQNYSEGKSRNWVWDQLMGQVVKCSLQDVWMGPGLDLSSMAGDKLRKNDLIGKIWWPPSIFEYKSNCHDSSSLNRLNSMLCQYALWTAVMSNSWFFTGKPWQSLGYIRLTLTLAAGANSSSTCLPCGPGTYVNSSGECNHPLGGWTDDGT